MQFDLVFEGGGAKGTSFVGALEEFARRGYTSGRLTWHLGGAITATYLAAGFSVGEMLDALKEKRRTGRIGLQAISGPAATFTSMKSPAAPRVRYSSD